MDSETGRSKGYGFITVWVELPDFLGNIEYNLT